MKTGWQKVVFWSGMLLVAVGVVLSVNGAFAGAARAKAFFNSLPMAVFWCMLLAVLGISLWGLARRRQPVLWMLHGGCCLVLVGGLWGSDWSVRHFSEVPISKGFMLLYEGQASPLVVDKTMTRYERLPFSIQLVKTWAVYYEQTDAAQGPATVKDYYSLLRVMRGDTVLREATIEVNRPLYYGGYHFYQHTFGSGPLGTYSGLMVTSVRGLRLVFAGYAVIVIALFWHFGWRVCFRRAMRREEPA